MSHDDTVNALNQLIQTCKDGEDGFRHGAEQARGAPLREVLQRRAGGYAEAATELQALVVAHGGDAAERGSTTAAVQRGWQSVKSTIAGYTDASLLEEMEGTERATLERYKTALQQTALPAFARSAIDRQQQQVLQGLAQLQILIENGKK